MGPRSRRAPAARRLALAAFCLSAAVLAAAPGQSNGPVLEPGDPAPDFTLPGSDGRPYSLADYRGVRPVVLAWFPKAFAKE